MHFHRYIGHVKTAFDSNMLKNKLYKSNSNSNKGVNYQIVVCDAILADQKNGEKTDVFVLN